MFKIRNDIQMPAPPETRTRSKYPLSEMEKGSCFDIEPKHFVSGLDAEGMLARVKNTLKEHNRRKGGKFWAESLTTVLTDEVSGEDYPATVVRVWCEKPMPRDEDEHDGRGPG